MLDSQYYTECISTSVSVLMKQNAWRQQSHLQALTIWEEFWKQLSAFSFLVKNKVTVVQIVLSMLNIKHKFLFLKSVCLQGHKMQIILEYSTLLN